MLTRKASCKIENPHAVAHGFGATRGYGLKIAGGPPAHPEAIVNEHFPANDRSDHGE